MTVRVCQRTLAPPLNRTRRTRFEAFHKAFQGVWPGIIALSLGHSPHILYGMLDGGGGKNMHPLYPVASRLVGRQIYCAHVSGQVYRGLLQSVTTSGIYLMPTRGVTMATATDQELGVDIQIDSQTQDDTTVVFFPAAFFAFGALAGLGLGYAAGRRPYYYY